MIKKLRGSLLSNEKPQDENVMWIDTSNPESFTLKLFRNGDWKPLHVVGTTRDMIERELTGYVTSHYHSYDKIINKPTTLRGYGITDCFNKTEIESLLNKKVTKVSGKSLSTNDFNNEYKKILDELPISYYNKNELDNLFNNKQNIISDLDNIREGAEKGNNASNILTDIVEAGYVFAGVATPTTNPGVPDAKVFYIANGKGTYNNFGGLKVAEDEVVILYYDTEWHKVATGIATEMGLSELENKLIGVTDFTFDFIGESIPISSFKDVAYKTIPGHRYRIIVRTESDNLTYFRFYNGKTYIKTTSQGNGVRIVDYLCTQESDIVRMIYSAAGTPELYEVSIIDLTLTSLLSNKDVLEEIMNGKTSVYRMCADGVSYDCFSLKKGSTITCIGDTILSGMGIKKPDGTSINITLPYVIPEDGYTLIGAYLAGSPIFSIEITTDSALQSKVDREIGKSLIDEKVADSFLFTDSPEFIKALVDSDKTLIYGIRKNGDIVLGAGVPNQVKEYVQTLLKSYETGKVSVNAESVRALMLHPYRILVDKVTEFNYVVPFNEIDGLIVLE